MEPGHGVDQGQADPVADPVMAAHRLGNDPPDHNAVPPFHHEEVGAGDVVVVAEQVGPWRQLEVLPEPRQHLVFAPHVVSAGGQGAERRAPKHQFVVAEGDQVGEVGRPVRELVDRERSIADDLARQIGPQVRLDRRPVEPLTRSDLGRLRRRRIGERIDGGLWFH